MPHGGSGINLIIERVIETLVAAGIPARCMHDGIRSFVDPASALYSADDPTDRRGRLCMVTTTGWEPYEGNDYDAGHVSGLYLRQHRILVRYWEQVDDPQRGNSATTEVTARGRLESYCDALEANRQLRKADGSGTPAAQNCTRCRLTLGGQDIPLAIGDAGQGAAAIPCHYGEITYGVVERIV